MLTLAFNNPVGKSPFYMQTAIVRSSLAKNLTRDAISSSLQTSYSSSPALELEMRRLRFRESALLCTLIKRNADSSLLLSYEDSISTFLPYPTIFHFLSIENRKLFKLTSSNMTLFFYFRLMMLELPRYLKITEKVSFNTASEVDKS